MQACSDALSFLFAMPFTFYFLNGLKKKQGNDGLEMSVRNDYDGE
jgi:hypothetical protein